MPGAAAGARRRSRGRPWSSHRSAGRARAWRRCCPAGEPIVDPDLGDICLGFLESQPRAAYREWRKTHGVDEAPEGGESRLAAVARYARGLRRLAEETPHPALVVTHDQPIRYLLNVLAGADPVLGPASPVPNATPYPFSTAMLAEGARRLTASLG